MFVGNTLICTIKNCYFIFRLFSFFFSTTTFVLSCVSCWVFPVWNVWFTVHVMCVLYVVIVTNFVGKLILPSRTWSCLFYIWFVDDNLFDTTLTCCLFYKINIHLKGVTQYKYGCLLSLCFIYFYKTHTI